MSQDPKPVYGDCTVCHRPQMALVLHEPRINAHICHECFDTIGRIWVQANMLGPGGIFPMTPEEEECDHFHDDDGKEIANDVEKFFGGK